MKSEQMFICLSSIAIQGILRSQIIVEMTLSVMRSRGPRKSQKMLKKRGGSDVQKAMCCQKRKGQIAEPSGDGRGAESMSPASEKVDPRAV